jgi:transposase InsO family protein
MTLPDKELQIALFKFKLIAPVLNDGMIKKKDYFIKLSEQIHDVPFLGKKQYALATFKKWAIKYRKYGFDGLKPSFRKDKGLSRCISSDLENKIVSLVTTYRFRTVQNLYDYLLDTAVISQNQFTYVTLNNFVKNNDLFDIQFQKKERRAFEVSHINELWLADFMYGPHVMDGRRKRQAYLCAIICDHSRLIVNARFYFTQSNLSFEQSLKDAITAYGIPTKVYTDNGKMFLDGHLSLLSARLGFIMVHSKPHESAPRGKIERYFRTVRDCFIPNHYIKFKNKPFTLEELNQSFSKWLLYKYNKKKHSTIKMTPFDRYFSDLSNVKVRKASINLLQTAFLHTTERKVNNDSTISFEGKLYEVNAKYIGEKIQIRFDPQKKDELYLFENDKQIAKLSKLDKHANSKQPIKFHKEED